MNAEALRLLREYTRQGGKRPLFLFVHYFDVHAPYVNHEHADAAPAKPSNEWMVDAYDSGIRYVDAHIRELWSAVQAAHLSGEVMLAITADHGEQLGEHGYLGGHADIYRETVRIPLILSGPGIPRQRIGGAVSSMDLAPTLLNRAGLHFTQQTDGRTLVPVLNGGPVNARRRLLVIGYPAYARSVAVREGTSYFLRNLEWVYRDVTIAPDGTPETAPAGETVASFTMKEQTRRFSIPPIDSRPFAVTARLRARPGCEYHLTMWLPGEAEFVHNVMLTGSVKIDYSVARLDSTIVAVHPAECVEGLTWSLSTGPLPNPADASSSPATSYLYKLLLTARKDTVSDERYDLATDPAMNHNLIDETSLHDLQDWRSLVERTFETLHGADGQVEFSPEERQRLKALGYIPG